MPHTGKALAGVLVTLGIPVPVAAATVRPDLVAQRPAASIVLLVAYEAALVLIGLRTRTKIM